MFDVVMLVAVVRFVHRMLRRLRANVVHRCGISAQVVGAAPTTCADIRIISGLHASRISDI